ncbi:MAG TPA: aldo/keto reductase [Solirubrobacteraceae bacterium]|nr:aldo/keto reductase [Solirubrobacteraceae bacterium]
MPAPTRSLADLRVPPIGLGAMPMSVEGRPEEAQSIRTIHAALDAGVRLIDTADAYCLDEAEFGHNEALVARALRGRGEEVVVATKAGHVRRGTEWALDGRPEHLRAACEASLRRLGTESIDLLQLHRPDPQVPFAESVGALGELRAEGKVRRVGVSNVDVAQIEQARRIADVASVQNQLSAAYPNPLARGEVRACEEYGIAFLPWSPLGGIGRADDPDLIAPVREAARRHGVSPQRVALAWLLALSPAIVAIPGSKRPETILDSLAAAELDLTPEEVEGISARVERSP